MSPLSLPEKFIGTETIHIVKDDLGPTSYVPGRGADYVPSRIGTGAMLRWGEAHANDEVLVTFDEVNLEGANAILRAAEDLIAAKKRCTYKAIMSVLVQETT